MDLQLRDYLSNHKQKKIFSNALTQLETICLKGTKTRKTTFITYSWLQMKTNEKQGHFRNLWEKSLDMNVSDEQWMYA